MSEAEVNMCVAILEDHFGATVAMVGEVLLCESTILPVLCRRLKQKAKPRQVQRALVILEQHGLVQFALDDRQSVVYSIQPDNVLRLIRSARCSLVAKTLYGEIAETICEELISQGRLSCSQCIRRVAARLDEDFNEKLAVAESKNGELGKLGDAKLKNIKVIFVRLAESQMLIRCPQVENSFCGFPTFREMPDAFIVPDVILDQKNVTPDKTENGSKSRKRKEPSDTKLDSDSDIYWRLNFARFERYLRDEMVISEYESIDKCNEKCIKVLRLLIKISEVKVDTVATTSCAISIHDVVRASKANQMDLQLCDIEVALTMLSENSNGIVRKVGSSAGGLYIIDFQKTINSKCQKHIESSIREQLNSRAVRIFRLLVDKKYLEEDHIEKLAMLSTVETREICVQLVERKFAAIKCVPKANDFSPSRTIYMHHVDLRAVAQNVYLSTCKALRNVIIRRRHETKEHKNLIDRQLKMETIVANIESDESLDEETKKQQIGEVEEIYLTAGDRTQLEKYRNGQIALLSAEIELDYDLLLLRLFINSCYT